MECDAAPFACAVVGETGGSSSTSPSCGWTAGFCEVLAVFLLTDPEVPAERRGAVRIVRLPRPRRRPAPLACRGSHSPSLIPQFCSRSLRPSFCSSSSWTWKRRLQFGQSKFVFTPQFLRIDPWYAGGSAHVPLSLSGSDVEGADMIEGTQLSIGRKQGQIRGRAHWERETCRVMAFRRRQCFDLAHRVHNDGSALLALVKPLGTSHY